MLRGLIGLVFGDEDEEASHDRSAASSSAADVTGQSATVAGGTSSAASAAQRDRDSFGEAAAAVHVALAERRYLHALSLVKQLEALRDTAKAHDSTSSSSTASSTSSTSATASDSGGGLCPYCGRRVASLHLHTKTCPAAAAAAVASGTPTSTNGSNTSSGRHAVADPQAEVCGHLRARVLDALVHHMQSLASAVEAGTDAAATAAATASGGNNGSSGEEAGEVRELWCAAAAEAPGDMRPTALFARVVVAQFKSYLADVCAQFDASRAAALQAEAGSSNTSNSSNSSSGEAGHPFLRRHVQLIDGALGHTLSQSQRSGGSEGSSSGSGSGSPATSASVTASASSGVGTAVGPAASLSQAHVEALSSLLAEASTWLVSIMEQPVPHTHRCAVATALHEACTAAALPLLAAYVSDSQLGAKLCVARALVAYTQDRLAPSEYGSGREWEAAIAAVVGRGAAAAATSASVTDSANASGSGSGIGSAGVSGSGSGAVAMTAEEAAAAAWAALDDTPLPPGAVAALGNGHDAATAADGSPSKQQQDKGREKDKGKGLEEDVLLITVTATATAGRKSKSKAKGNIGSAAASSTVTDGSGTAAPPPPPPFAPLQSSSSAQLLPPFPIPVPAAVAILDTACDEVSFMCQLLERHLRCVTAVLALGTADQPSRLQDDLSAAAQALTGDYVLLERAYLLNAVARAVSWRRGTGAGWAAVNVHDDHTLATFAWTDHAFFLLSKAIARAVGSMCDLAAAATLNFATGCLEQTVREAVDRCITMCSEPRHKRAGVGRGGAGGGSAGGGGGGGASGGKGASDGDKAEGALAAQLRAALLGDAAEMEVARNNGGSSGGGGGGAGGGADRAEGEEEEAQPVLSDDALCAFNSVVTTVQYASSLYHRTKAEVEALYPAPAPSTTTTSATSGAAATKGGSASPVSPASPGATTTGPALTSAVSLPPVAHCHAQVRTPLEELRTAAETLSRSIDTAARAAVHAAAGPGLAALARALAAASYDISAEQYDGLSASGSGAANGGGGGGMAGRGRGGTGGRGGDASSSSAAAHISDPVTAAFLHALLHDSTVRLFLPRLLRPVGSTAVVRALTAAVADCYEKRWWSPITATTATGTATGTGVTAGRQHIVSEWGALLMGEQLRVVSQELLELLPSAPVRTQLSRLQQGVQVLAVDSLTDLYALSFPAPRLSRSEVVGLLACKSSLPPGSIGRIDWDRVRCTANDK